MKYKMKSHFKALLSGLTRKLLDRDFLHGRNLGEALCHDIRTVLEKSLAGEV